MASPGFYPGAPLALVYVWMALRRLVIHTLYDRRDEQVFRVDQYLFNLTL
jgi:hypothetical protein